MPRLTCPVILLLINTAPRNVGFAQDVLGQIHPCFNSPQTGLMPGEGLARIIAVIESEGLADAEFQQVWIWNNRHWVVPDTAVKENVSWEGQLQDEV